MIASAGFAFHVADFASCDKTYGTMAGIVVFLIWLWISNLAILLGLEFDAEAARRRAIAGGRSPEASRPGTSPAPGPVTRAHGTRRTAAACEKARADRHGAPGRGPRRPAPGRQDRGRHDGGAGTVDDETPQGAEKPRGSASLDHCRAC
jgi:hypothetical protein